jgi:hypothetical protein
MSTYEWMFNARQFDAEFTDTSEDGEIIEIMKVGGGTPGREYDGAWLYKVRDKDYDVVTRGQVNTGTPHTHAYVAAMVAEERRSDG